MSNQNPKSNGLGTRLGVPGQEPGNSQKSELVKDSRAQMLQELLKSSSRTNKGKGGWAQLSLLLS